MISVDNSAGHFLLAVFNVRVWLTGLLLSAMLTLLGCGSGPNVVTFSGVKFGTTYNVIIVADQPVPENLSTLIDAALDRIDASMSTYIASSEISRFNGLAVGDEVAVSDDFAHVFKISRSIWNKSNGALDPTVGPLVDLWGFGPTKTDDEIPSASQISLAMSLRGFDGVNVRESLQDLLISKSRPTKLDFSAVAKGYAVDVIAELLEMNALPDYLVEIGGETRVSGFNPEGRPWRLGIQVPQLISEVEEVIALDGGAVATSGDYRNYFERDGHRYSHTIDPRTGYPIEHSTASVTVVADTCAEADAWATALLVLGHQDGIKLANKYNLPTFMIVRDEKDFKRVYSESFRPFLDVLDDKSITEK